MLAIIVCFAFSVFTSAEFLHFTALTSKVPFISNFTRVSVHISTVYLEWTEELKFSCEENADVDIVKELIDYRPPPHCKNDSPLGVLHERVEHISSCHCQRQFQICGLETRSGGCVVLGPLSNPRMIHVTTYFVGFLLNIEGQIHKGTMTISTENSTHTQTRAFNAHHYDTEAIDGPAYVVGLTCIAPTNNRLCKRLVASAESKRSFKSRIGRTLARVDDTSLFIGSFTTIIIVVAAAGLWLWYRSLFDYANAQKRIGYGELELMTTTISDNDKVENLTMRSGVNTTHLSSIDSMSRIHTPNSIPLDDPNEQCYRPRTTYL